MSAEQRPPTERTIYSHDVNVVINQNGQYIALDTGDKTTFQWEDGNDMQHHQPVLAIADNLDDLSQKLIQQGVSFPSTAA